MLFDLGGNHLCQNELSLFVQEASDSNGIYARLLVLCSCIYFGDISLRLPRLHSTLPILLR